MSTFLHLCTSDHAHDAVYNHLQATVGVLMGIGAFPWVVKPLYGFLSDSVPLFGYKRRSYLVACGLLGEALGSAASAATPGSSHRTTYASMGSSRPSATADVPLSWTDRLIAGGKAGIVRQVM